MMNSIGRWTIALAALSFGLVAEVSLEQTPTGTHIAAIVSPGQVYAAPRNVARRTGRRTTRRVVRRTSIAGCAPYRAYFNCGGVYYRAVVESGTTVYVVVTP